jgi:hypothetical protein
MFHKGKNSPFWGVFSLRAAGIFNLVANISGIKWGIVA